MTKTLAATVALAALATAFALPATSGPAKDAVQVAAAELPRVDAVTPVQVEAKAALPVADRYAIRAEDATVSALRFDPPADACAF